VPRHAYWIAPLLLVSGLSALVYQVCWLRELRLVFGASTPASAAVLAVFMGGLGWGSLVLGKRADRVARPLRMVALLEAGIALGAALSPALLLAARWVYVAVGGTTALGPLGGTVARLLLAALVLLGPTFLMGGTLPAAARAAAHGQDLRRRSTALLYGVNTLGAVLGAAAGTFVLLEQLGTRLTLWIGCLLSAVGAISAWALDLLLDARAPAPAEDPQPDTKAAASPSRPELRGRVRVFVLAAAAASGFAFLLMELVWYRVLSPLLGGSSYTFGLILAVALAGIGLGGVGYALRSKRRPARLGTFAATCALEALLLAVPYALGDRVALLALLLRGFGAFGLAGHAAGWTVVAAVVVLPAAVVAGYQFPLLISLLGRGDRRLGRHVGLAYGFNTAGAIVGSLAGGFVLLPLLSALGLWALSVWLLIAMAVVALVLELRATAGERSPRRGPAVTVVVAALAALAIVATEGPTAAWRHSPIGAGRWDGVLRSGSRNGIKASLHERRRAITWEADGRESTIGLYTLNDTSFMVNGKSDGAAVSDGATQVMSGLLGALLHPREIEDVLVIGLGTGSTAGWLARLPSIRRVDVVELEPAILEVARTCQAVNAGALDNPRLHVTIGDAREVLLTTRRDYDLIFSEPSNPYRAGVASLFTEELYRAARARLRPDGVFVQWVQGYEIDARSIRTIYATLHTAFPSVETWRSKWSDLVLVARAADQPLEPARLRARMATEPYRSALMAVWRANALEDVLARFLARPELARAVAERVGPAGVNTDDRNVLEFAFARALGRVPDFDVDHIRAASARRGELRPSIRAGADDGPRPIDWPRVDDAYISMGIVQGDPPNRLKHTPMTDTQRERYQAQLAWTEGDMGQVVASWQQQDQALPQSPVQIMVLADAYAWLGDERASELIEQLRPLQPTEAMAITARLHWARNERAQALEALAELIAAYRSDPWPNALLLSRALPIAADAARLDRRQAQPMFALLAEPFAVHMLDYLRLSLRLELALMSDDSASCLSALDDHGRYVPWERTFLLQRLACLRQADHPHADEAEADLAAFTADKGPPFDHDLPAVSSPQAPASAPSGSARDGG